MIFIGMAIRSMTALDADQVVFRREIEVVGDHEIDFSVMIIVEPTGARTPLAGVFDGE